MLQPILFIAYSMIGKSGLPDLSLPGKGWLGVEGETSLDELNDAFKRHMRADQEMNMVRHEDKVMKVKFFPVPLHNIQKRKRPAFVAEKSLPAERLEADKVGSTINGGAKAPPLQSNSKNNDNSKDNN